MEHDGAQPQRVGKSVPADGPSRRRRGGAVLVASLRVGAGSIFIARTGLARLLDAAIDAGPAPQAGAAPDGSSARGPAPVPSRALPARVGHVASGTAARAGRVASAVVGTTPPVLRVPFERRLATWRAVAVEEQAASIAVATAALELAAGFMTDWIVERLDVNRIVERLRLDDIIANLELTDVILSSSGGVTGHVLDNARARAVGADALVERAMSRVRRRHVPVGDGRDGAAAISADGDRAAPP